VDVSGCRMGTRRGGGRVEDGGLAAAGFMGGNDGLAAATAVVLASCSASRRRGCGADAEEDHRCRGLLQCESGRGCDCQGDCNAWPWRRNTTAGVLRMIGDRNLHEDEICAQARRDVIMMASSSAEVGV
jgi:hypothetical protein